MSGKKSVPGELIRYATTPGSLGTVLAAWSEQGVCAILLGDEPGLLIQDLAKRFPNAICQPDPESEIFRGVIRFLEEPESQLEFPLDLRGTPFQRRVWDALAGLPAGATTTYSGLAAELGVPAGARAVAAACAANPVAVAIPCHRVIRRNGSLTGYRWGIERKASLLARESCALPL
jgi:AraC family transcriptional regulator of adaptative response/methylated-DNA-[protein]-cysteine methyltransferase